MTSPLWQSAARPPALPAGTVHVWQIDLEADPIQVPALASVLADDEAQRANRFMFPEHRRRFAVSRGVLRHLLGGYLDIAPAAVTFAYGAHGKPMLATDPTLQFNLSHTHERALLAVCSGAPLGIDVEWRPRHVVHLTDLAKRMFSASEFAQLQALPEFAQREAFFRCWTRKEAFIKAIGDGFSFPLDAFEVTLGPDDPARLVQIHGDAGAAAAWSLYNLVPDPDYQGALIVAGRGWEVTQWRWSG